MNNPKSFLEKATAILKNLDGMSFILVSIGLMALQVTIIESQSARKIQFEQVVNGDVFGIKEEEEEKKELEFYGEPVPENGEQDDDELYEIAAGTSRGRKREEAPVIEEEPIPDHETIELDFCMCK